MMSSGDDQMAHVELHSAEVSMDELYGEQLELARTSIASWPADLDWGAASRSRQNLDTSPEPFLGFGIFLTLRPATPLGDTVVKIVGNRDILASRVDYYYYHFVQALARIITVYGLYIAVLFCYLLLQYTRGTRAPLSATYEQVFFGEMIHAIGSYMLLAVASFVALGRATRIGRIGALSAMSKVQGHHFMFAYLGEEQSRLAGTLASLLSAQGFHIWMDAYRLENACSAERAHYEAARQAAFRVMCVTEHFVTSHQFRFTLAAALECDSRGSTVIHFDKRHDQWAASDAGRLAIAAFKAEGFLVTTSVEELVKAVDAIVMSSDDYVSGWWRSRKLAPVYGLTRAYESMRVTCGREKRYSLHGRLFMPSGAITSGIHYISADGTEMGRMLFVPAPAIIAVLVLLWGSYSFVAPFLHDKYPYFTFWWPACLARLTGPQVDIRGADHVRHPLALPALGRQVQPLGGAAPSAARQRRGVGRSGAWPIIVAAADAKPRRAGACGQLQRSG